ncbi:MAG: septal ring lytic transglycosylase RlpA family protein [Terriglobales bacterium]
MKGLARRLIFALLFSVILSSCGRHKVATVDVPSAPPPSAANRQNTSSDTSGRRSSIGKIRAEENADDVEALSVPLDTKPVLVETGIASWYGPPYHNRRGSDGKIYNMNAMTAAHRTLPLGSIVRVTNLKTGHWAIVRITDRGPFIKGRIIDLSLAAARKIDVERAGLAEVRLEVLQTPAAIDNGGRWAVQIGSFAQQESAAKTAERISRRYQSAKVSSFVSPVGDWWVRVRVLHDDRTRAQEIARDTKQDAKFDRSKIFLVRLD